MQAQITTPVARLTETESGHVVHGVALGEGDETRGAYGLKRWPREALEPAAASLASNSVTHLYDNPKQHGGERIGRVTRSAYEPGVGVVYEALLSDAEVARKLSLGQFEVSIEASSPERVEHDDEAAILHGFEFDGMAVVENGASPSNHSSAGSAADNAAIAALSADDIAAKLASYSVEYSGTSGGQLDESEIPSDDFASHYLISGDTKSDSSYPVVDASGNLRRGNVSSAWDLRGHAPDESSLRSTLLDLNDAFDNPPIETDDEQAENAAPAGDDSPNVDSEESQAGETDSDNDSESTMTDEDNGEQYEELAAKLAERDDRVEELREQVEELDSENAELASRVGELEDAEEDIASVKEVYAAELANGSFTEADLVEKFTVAELREKFEEDDEADLVDDDPEPDVQSGGGDDSAKLSLDDDVREDAKDIKQRIEYWDGKNDTIAEAEKAELAELTGADSADDVMEAI